MALAASLLYGAVIVGIAVLPGCVRTVTKVDSCGSWQPIIPDGKDALTTDTANQILAHDCRGYHLGCWKPAGIENACAAPATAAPLPAAK